MKIEASPLCAGVPRDDAAAATEPAGRYFEHHVKLLLAPDADTARLVGLAMRHAAHVSRNALRAREDGRLERFVTQRCHRVGRPEARRRFEALLAALTGNGYEVIDAAPNTRLDPLAEHIGAICDHMNQDHADALSLCAKAFAETTSESARMIHVDSHGFDMVATEQGNHRHYRIDFDSPVATPDEVRAAMIELVRRGREMTSYPR